MTNPHKNLETLLSAQGEVGLTESEKTIMFSELQAFAELYAPQVAVTANTKSSYAVVTWFSRWAVGIASVFLLTVGTGAASTQSLPGDTLYSVKVSVVEPLIGLTYFSESEKLSYQVMLFERRLDEMETLYRNEELTSAEVLVLESTITEHTNDLADLVVAVDTASVSATSSLEAVSAVAVTLEKQSLLIDKELGLEHISILDEMQVTVDELYGDELQEFVTTQPEQVNSYVEDLLTKVDEQVAADPETASSSAVALSEYLDVVETTLEQGDLIQAVESADEASQLLKTTDFFETLGQSASEVVPITDVE